MTETARNLIQRLTEKLDLLHCQYNVPNQSALIDEAHAYLDQPEPPSRLRHCPTHGQQPENAWGCPECVREMRQQLAQPEPEVLEPGYIDPEHKGQDRELLEVFYKACRSEGGSADEIHLRGLKAVIALLSQPEPEGPPLEPRGCPTPGACSCPTSPTVPPELIRALELAEAALADIGDAEREPGDDLAWAEARAAQDLPRIRIALDRWGRPAVEPKTNGTA